MARRDTRADLLDAAEQVLLEHGLAGLSVRRITAVANANVAAVNYTFGSKDRLLEALMLRVLEPANSERTRRLEELVRAGGYTIEDLLRAFLEPLIHANPRTAALFIELGIKPRLDGDGHLETIRQQRVQAGIDQMTAAIAPLVPTMSPQVIGLRIELVLGMTAMHMFEARQLAEKYGVAVGNHAQYLIDDLVTFFAAGLCTTTRLVPKSSADARNVRGS